MKNWMRLGLLVGGCALAGFVLSGAAQTKGGKKGPAILQQEWGKVEGGSYSAPMGKLGTKGETWTATTMGAAVNGQANAGRVGTVVGEILDFSCYMQIGKHGEKHRSCAQKCFTAGQPIGLLAQDGTMYMLMEEEHDPRRDGLTDFRKTAIEHAAHIMEVTGTIFQHGGYRALYVQGYLKK